MACDILKADVLALAPQLSTLSDHAWAIVLNYVNDYEDLDCDPTLKKLALCLLAAHNASIMGSSGAGASGATTSVVSESAGGLKRTYAQPTASSGSSEYSRTTYGQQFLAIMMASSGTRGPILV